MGHYLAGYFDAKGTISCSLKKGSRRMSEFYVRISTSSQRRVLEALQVAYGGSVTEHGIEGQRSVYTWCVYSGSAAQFLESMRQHSRLRQREIDLGLSFYASLKAHGGRSVTADTLRLRQEIINQLGALKKRRKVVA